MHVKLQYTPIAGGDTVLGRATGGRFDGIIKLSPGLSSVPAIMMDSRFSYT